MPAHAYRTSVRDMNAYARVRRLSTQHERDAASAAVERLVDAGLSYAEACAAVREQREAARDDRADEPVASQTLGRTAITRLSVPARGRLRARHAPVRP